MKPTVEYIEKKFDEFNEKYFDSKLERVPIELWTSKRTLGQCMYRVRRTILGKKHYYDFKIRINERLDMPEDELDDVLIHEMIHLRIFSKPYNDRWTHGPVFKKIMNHINERYGRHIRIRYRFSEEDKDQLLDATPHWKIVVVVDFKDGVTRIKVLTNNGLKVAAFWDIISKWRTINGCHLYLTKEPFFNRYPVSTSLTFYSMTQDKLVLYLKDATVIDNLKWEGRLTKRKLKSLINK